MDGASLAPKSNPYDWLGRGIHFWEHGLDRAEQFAHEKKADQLLESAGGAAGFAESSTPRR